jgi:hypothetical protein
MKFGCDYAGPPDLNDMVRVALMNGNCRSEISPQILAEAAIMISA